MSERPVPRRESPWGMPEGDHRQPVAHRCNDRVEDVIQVVRWGSKNCVFLRGYDQEHEVDERIFTNKYSARPFIFAPNYFWACFEGNPFKTVPGPFKLFYECMRSKPGEEPTAPFFYLELDPPTREVKLE